MGFLLLLQLAIESGKEVLGQFLLVLGDLLGRFFLDRHQRIGLRSVFDSALGGILEVFAGNALHVGLVFGVLVRLVGLGALHALAGKVLEVAGDYLLLVLLVGFVLGPVGVAGQFQAGLVLFCLLVVGLVVEVLLRGQA